METPIGVIPQLVRMLFSSRRTDELCRYCTHQRLKLSNGKIKSPSRFCPTDLVSGDETSMNYALDALLDNPQNNLKIFLDGTIRFHENSDYSDLSFLQESGLFGDADDTKALLKRMLIEVGSAFDVT